MTLLRERVPDAAGGLTRLPPGAGCVREAAGAQCAQRRWRAALRPPPFRHPRRSATFDVVFLDAGLRVTRGDRGELRVYARDDGSGAPALDGWGL